MYWGQGRQDNEIKSLSAGKQNSYFVNSRWWAGEWGLALFVLRQRGLLGCGSDDYDGF